MAIQSNDMELERLLMRLRLQDTKRIAVAAAADEVVLQAVCEAHRLGIVTAILCGDGARIAEVAERHRLDISAFEIVEAVDEDAAARVAVNLVSRGEADLLMKGLLQTADLLRAVLNREEGLRSGAVLSHVGVVHSPILERMLLLTDAAMLPYPDLQQKSELINNAVLAAKGLGINCPKVAPLAAVEVVNPAMPATLDAAALTQMNRRGQIRNCVVDGPLAMDLALSPNAAEHKQVRSEVAGKADILLFHNIEAANSALKVFTHGGNSLFGGVVMGARAPIILASRADSNQSKLYSIACAATISEVCR